LGATGIADYLLPCRLCTLLWIVYSVKGVTVMS